MKKLLLIIVFLIGFVLNAQTKSVQLQWTEKNFVTSTGDSFFIPYFQSEYFSYNPGSKVITAKVFLDNVQGNNVRMVSHQLQAVELSKYKDLNTTNIPTQINPKVEIYTTRS